MNDKRYYWLKLEENYFDIKIQKALRKLKLLSTIEEEKKYSSVKIFFSTLTLVKAYKKGV